MKTPITPLMQKAQKLVIKIVFLVSLFVLSSSVAQVNSDAYVYAGQIINLTSQPNDMEYELNQSVVVNKHILKKYYEFRTQGKPFFKYFAVDNASDSIQFDSIQLKKDMVRWKDKYKYLDSLFSENDIKLALNDNEPEKKWNTSHLIFNKNNYLVKWCTGFYCKNSISKAYYNYTKTHAYVWSSHIDNNRRYVDLYIFQKKEDDWLLIEKIEDVGW